jgi:hypothetical protein
MLDNRCRKARAQPQHGRRHHLQLHRAHQGGEPDGLGRLRDNDPPHAGHAPTNALSLTATEVRRGPAVSATAGPRLHEHSNASWPCNGPGCSCIEYS